MSTKDQIIGTWKLESFQLESPEGTRTDWGKNPHGLLIYSDTGLMSVSINKTVENDPDQNETQNLFDSILFYAGTYRVEENTIKHQVTEASNPERIGREMIRFAEFNNNVVTLVTPKESFGRAILVWRKV